MMRTNESCRASSGREGQFQEIIAGMNFCFTQFRARLAGFLPVVTVCFAGGALAAETPAQALHQVRNLIGDATCSDDVQCRTVAIGNRACGGPDAYIAWSTQKTDADALQRAVNHYSLVQSQGASVRGRTSICSVAIDPGAVCLLVVGSAVDGVTPKSCQLRPVNAAPAQPTR